MCEAHFARQRGSASRETRVVRDRTRRQLLQATPQGSDTSGLRGREVFGFAGVGFEVEQAVWHAVGGVSGRKRFSRSKLTHRLDCRVGLGRDIFRGDVPVGVFVTPHNKFPVAHPKGSGQATRRGRGGRPPATAGVRTGVG